MNMDELLSIMATLRDPQKGCPWDLEQTMDTIAPHTLEEAYELVDAIENKDNEHIVSELGDLLFQVVFYCQIAKENYGYGFEEVVKKLCEKMKARHPHIFSDASVRNADEQSILWEKIKADERQGASVLSDVPLNLPALSRAQKIQKRAANVGFDWEHPHQVFDKICEEVEELKQELDDPEKAQEELGDLMFACTNLARWLKVDAEQLLRLATSKFERRFNQVEKYVQDSLKPWDAFTLDELEDFWGKAKNDESK